MTAANQTAAQPQHGATSAWHTSASLPRYSPLMSTDSADVCVIGAGIAGLSTAYMLLREGKSVVVLDALGVGAGETGRTTAHLFPPDERFFEIERSFGSAKAALVADTYRKATDCIEAIVRTERIDCEFERVDGYLFNPDGAWNDILEREYAITTRLGLNVRRFERVPGLHFDTGPCLRFARQAQFHPLKYLDGLARAIERLGGRIYDRTRALGLRAEAGRQHVTTEHGQVDAAAVVVATNTPFNDRVAMHTRQAAYRTYVVALRVPKDAIARVLLWDTGDPYHYARLASAGTGADHELLVVGGQDHKSGQDAHAQQRYDQIEAWTRRRFPLAGEVAYRWSGEVMEPSDGLAFLGRHRLDHENVYVITGDSGNGMTHCTAGAILVTDLIVGRSNVWSELYSPSRTALHGLGDFITGQANTLAQYTDWLRGGDVESAGQIARGEGALLRDGGRLLAVYRDDDGGLQAVSAACTHLGCAVHWNAGEKSWDCPCHGSRFAPDGEVLHGPAKRALAAATLEGDLGGGAHPATGEERRTD
ncbi:FAD-dependent oxidoreductase [Massilia violaceinigra]|uniref:FAD-dependent oxidoreductase n=1 Tax=Massilia violaceinigra TaxID=2045208 RepID=A0ABY4ACA4_9BURK|nr:FAD-dependent oxidoreductase [Massilia violaceinigra]UOD31304.1 FAD-dependent oxidoreductase [Massilia violaceinigra]